MLLTKSKSFKLSQADAELDLKKAQEFFLVMGGNRVRCFISVTHIFVAYIFKEFTVTTPYSLQLPHVPFLSI